MRIGIVGLPQSGKTTVFTALVGGSVLSQTASAATHLGTAKVPDPRLGALAAIFHPRRVVAAEVQYVDVAPPQRGTDKGQWLSGPLLAELSRMDAFIHVVRYFSDERVPHVQGSIDPDRDIATMDLELAFSDLTIIEHRLQRLETSLKAARSHEREPLLAEQRLILRIKDSLEKEMPLWQQTLTPGEARTIENFQFLTARPLLAVLNIGENDITRAEALETELRARHPRPNFQTVAICGKLEMELAQLNAVEAGEFRVALGLTEAARDRVIRLSYELLGLITFFTHASDELKAWPVPRGTTAVKAAGKIHSDMERGFIRAEAIGHDDLVKCGGLAEARKRGLLRLEGKSYVVQDGDVITFMFNV
ncbi:MAG: redox-regulated ATPase YchF [Chloroflexi bacterium]|nr:redox-regulated ATPase YchF [Chloroflexota bacterium]